MQFTKRDFLKSFTGALAVIRARTSKSPLRAETLPSSYSGLNDGPPDICDDADFTYRYCVSLAPNQTLLHQAICIPDDAYFVWRGLFIASFTGTFNVRFYDSDRWPLSPGYGFVQSTNLLVDEGRLFPVSPERLIPAGGKIGIDIQDTSGSANTVEILARGVKRYRRLNQGT